MVQLIVGNRGKGKTKYLLDSVNEAMKNASGNIVYIDKSLKNMYELNNKIRLIDSVINIKNTQLLFVPWTYRTYCRKKQITKSSHFEKEI